MNYKSQFEQMARGEAGGVPRDYHREEQIQPHIIKENWKAGDTVELGKQTIVLTAEQANRKNETARALNEMAMSRAQEDLSSFYAARRENYYNEQIAFGGMVRTRDGIANDNIGERAQRLAVRANRAHMVDKATERRAMRFGVGIIVGIIVVCVLVGIVGRYLMTLL